MRVKRGFTLIEVLVVIVVIAIIALLAFPSYRRARLTSQNEMARAKLMEIANAARMFNEDNSKPVFGAFEGACDVDYRTELNITVVNPLCLFLTSGNDFLSAYSYLKTTEWNTFPDGCTDDCLFHYRGYTFFICNPNSATAQGQPADSGCDGTQIAIMHGPATQMDDSVRADAVEVYGGFRWWVSRENLGIIGSNFGG